MVETAAGRPIEKLEKYLAMIKAVFDVEEIIGERQENQRVREYYLATHLAYLFFYNRHGFMHMGISMDGTYREEDLFEPLRIIDAYLKDMKAGRVLELGAGNGSNSAWLARQNPAVDFSAVDLSKKLLRKNSGLVNFRQMEGDYHDLKALEDESFDAAFVIEALCHSTDKRKVLEEVKKKLKPGGLFIVLDGYALKPRRELSSPELLAQRLTEKSMAVEAFENIDDFRNTVDGSGFSVVVERDLTENVMPTMRKFERLALAFYHFPLLAKLIRIILRLDIVKNSAAGLLMPTMLELGLDGYFLHVFKKD
jgi:SAM-dependent methyltransferase